MKVFFFVILFAIFCTVLAANATERIIGGQNADIKSYPYQVQIEHAEGGLHCGGSIVSQYHVLTAAHCQRPMNLLRVRAGTSFRGIGGSLHEVLSFIKHEKYRLSNMPVNDIAIIKIKEPFNFDETRRPIDLFSNRFLLPGSKAVVTGFGRIEGNGMLPDQLQMMNLRIVSKGTCNLIYFWVGGIHKGHICACAKGKSTCFGDSGGPLVINNRLAGIVSWVAAGCNTKFPSGYTEVAYYRDWINEHLF